jgi:hypothetical protein
MKNFYRKQSAAIVLLIFVSAFFTNAQKTSVEISEQNVRAHMGFLASDALQGRGSGTQFEQITGYYFASMMQQFGIEPAGQKDASGKTTYIQTVNIIRNSFADNPKLVYSANGASAALEHGKEMIVLRMNTAAAGGGLQKMNLGEKPQSGAVVFVRPSADAPVSMQNLQTLAASGAAAIIVEENAQWRANWSRFASRKVSFTTISDKPEKSAALIVVSSAEAAKLAQIADGTNIEIKGELAPPQKQQTWNAVGKITGGDAQLSAEVILLSAHMDHLGVRPNAPGEDKIFNGADDDASGCVAVLELARILAGGAKPKRTVYFAFYGSEEAGGFGAGYFVDNLEFPKANLAANLQFEMIGRGDAKVKPEELWLTGYERSNLGPELAKQGANLVADPHPEENFFQRSDNYALARQGIIAHTVSSFGLHKDYHQASDEIETIDFSHMTRAINSMVKPVQWLVNSNFKPVWNEGKKP